VIINESVGTPVKKSLLALVLAVDAAAVVALFALPFDGTTERPLVLLCLSCLALLTGIQPVRVPALKLDFITSQPFIFVAMAALRPTAAVVIAMIAVLAAASRDYGERTLLRLIFNLGAMLLTVAATWWLFTVLGGTAGKPLEALIFPLAAAVLAFFLINSILMAAVVAIDKEQHFTRTWRECFAWNAWCHFAGLTIAVAMLALLDHALIWCLLLAAAPCWLLSVYYRSQGRKITAAAAAQPIS
jgi:hypothetical protein